MRGDALAQRFVEDPLIIEVLEVSPDSGER